MIFRLRRRCRRNQEHLLFVLRRGRGTSIGFFSHGPNLREGEVDEVALFIRVHAGQAE